MKKRNTTMLGIALGIALAGQAAAQVASAQQGPPRNMEEQKTMPPQDPAWSRLDADGDGRISAVESDKDSKLGQAFDDLDTDDDGFVSDAEYGAFGKATPPVAPPTAHGATQSAAHSAIATRGTFSGLDSDKDGRVSSTEADADAGFDAGFSAMDGNGDGFVTDTEYRAHAKTTEKPATGAQSTRAP